MKKCIVNYITMNGWHPFGQKRLAKSIRREGFNGDLQFFTNLNLLCPSHCKVPYAFKFYAVKTAMERGYELILWVDASFWAIRRLDGLFDLIEEKGVVVQNSGYALGQWSSDASLNYLRVGREKAFQIMMYSGGLMGFNLKSSIGMEFFEAMFKEVKIGTAFKGSWTNRKQEVSKDSSVKGHRHDMVVGTVLAERMGIKMFPNNAFFSYYGYYKKYRVEKNLDNKIYFVIEGGTREI